MLTARSASGQYFLTVNMISFASVLFILSCGPAAKIQHKEMQAARYRLMVTAIKRFI